MDKKFFIASVVLIIVCSLLFVSCSTTTAETFEERYHEASYDAISMEDIYLPAKLDINELGLYWADYQGWVRYDGQDVPFDDNKPVIIFAHGMGTGTFGPYRQKWLDAGYNVGCFMWSEFSDDEPFTGQSKVWGVLSGKMRWRGTSKFEYEDIPSHSIAEIYAACYNDFFNSRTYSGSEIRLFGHSLGGQLTAALSSYFVAALDAGKMNPAFFPDRITLLDPFLCNDSDVTYISWRDSTLEDGGSVKAVLDTVRELKVKGTAVDFVRSSPWVEMAAYAKGDDGYNQALRSEVAHLEFDTGFLPLKYGIYNGIAACHEIGEDWYSGAIDQPIFPDCSEDATGEFGISPLTPTSYIFARMGTSYALDLNSTDDNYSDDTVRSLNIENPKIAGFVFLDNNGNGLMDDRIKCRMSGVKVLLYEKGSRKAVASCVTAENGYYEFTLEQNKEYYIKAEKIKDYKFLAKTSTDSYAASGTDSKGRSADFSPAAAAALIITNIGLIK